MIEPQKLYSLNEVVQKQLLGNVKSRSTAYKIVLEDKILPPKQRTLNATIIGDGQARRIYIRGENLQKYAAKIN